MVVTLTHVVLNVESVRQRGVLSPLLFNVYLNVLVKSLEISSLGCHLHGEYIGCLVYADDIVLLSASVVNLRRMLDVCHTVGATMDILLNAAKSTLFTVAKFCDNTINNLQIGNARIHWCKSLKYLGIYFQSDRSFKCNTDLSVRRFYTAANAIVSNTRYASELSQLFLMESYCLPLITYSCEALYYDRKQLQKLNVCWNNVYRKVFRMQLWESVKELQFFVDVWISLIFTV